jgi:CelD/BcsL family acetyltransferase involved in cellulose biosynthesis
VLTLIDEISQAAHEAIEKAAGEAARAAFLTSLDREATAYREAAQWRNEAQLQRLYIEGMRKEQRKNLIFTGAICLFGGLVLGIGGTLIIGGK